MKTGDTFTYIPWVTGTDDRELEVVKAAGFWSLVKDAATGQHGIYNAKLRRLHMVSPRIVGKRGYPYQTMARDIVRQSGAPQRIGDALVSLFA